MITPEPAPSEGGVPLPRLSSNLNLDDYSFEMPTAARSVDRTSGLSHRMTTDSADLSAIPSVSATESTRGFPAAAPQLETTVPSRPSSTATGVSNWPRRNPRYYHNPHGSMAGSSVSTGITSLSARPPTGMRSHGSGLSAPLKFHNPLSSAQLQMMRSGHAEPTISPDTSFLSENRPPGLADMSRLSFVSDDPGPVSPGMDASQLSSSGIPPRPGDNSVVSASDSTDRSKDATGGGGRSRTQPSLSPIPGSTTVLPNGSSKPFGLGHSQRGMIELSSAATSPSPTAGADQPKSRGDGDDVESAQGWTPQVQGKNYQYHLGQMIFCAGGRWMNTRERPLNLVTFVLVIIPITVFFSLSAPYVWHHISPAIPIVVAYLCAMCLSSFFHASFSDPGTLPRNLQRFPPREEHEKLRVDPRVQRVPVISFPDKPYSMITSLTGSANLEVPYGVIDLPVKYCERCMIWRPPRAHHCRSCDSCIETYDHHCMWLNNCVGRRNYRYFIVFVCTGWLSSFFIAAASLAHLVTRQRETGQSMDHTIRSRTAERGALAMVVYGFVAGLYPLVLWMYHLLLTARGETTREYRYSSALKPEERYLPFSLGSVVRNWLSIYFRPRPPTYLEFKKPHFHGDQRFGMDKSHTYSWARPRMMRARVVNHPVTASFERPARPVPSVAYEHTQQVEMRRIGAVSDV